MNRFGKIVVLLAGGLALNAGLRADDLALADSPDPLAGNPYASIVTRNVFNLNPPVVETNTPQDAGLPKITVSGIMTAFDRAQALFKVAGAAGKPGQPAKDQYYTLSEGQRQDDIEVVHIDQKAGSVTFNNHGTVQELALALPSSSSIGSSSAPAAGNNNPNGEQPNDNNGNNDNNGGRGFNRFGQRGNGFNGRGRGNNNPGGGASGSNNDESSNLRSVPSRTYQPQPSGMTPEQTALMIEAQRIKYQEQGNPIANILPPTPITDAVNNGQ